MLCEGEVCCLGQRRKASALCFAIRFTTEWTTLCMSHFVVARNTTASAALGGDSVGEPALHN